MTEENTIQEIKAEIRIVQRKLKMSTMKYYRAKYGLEIGRLKQLLNKKENENRTI
jgi:hypothetical protein